MFKIKKRVQFSPVTFLWEIDAPDIARAARPGHFVMVRHGDGGERVPLTIADSDPKAGTITLVIQAVGKSTRAYMAALQEGDGIEDLVGPLGAGRHFEPRRKVVCVGGGLGVAPVFPQLKYIKEELKAHTISIIGFRSKDFLFWEDRFKQYSDELLITTDDGSYGRKGFVTDALREVLDKNPDVDEVLAIGPMVMMKACVEVTRPRGVHTVVSLNPVMVDGTGMCGGCRVTVNGKMKFACVDGPEFDGHQVDFDELLLRSKAFQREQQAAMERKKDHNCKIGLEG